MPKLTIDNQPIDVPNGATILDAAAKLGIHIPTLCHRPGFEPSTSCMACVVKVNGSPNLVPSCATVAVEGMRVDSATDEVRAARQAAVELLLSEHVGDCMAPCQLVCPAGMDIPTMIRQIAAGDLPAAVRTIKAHIALPAALGRICPAPCERGCRRGLHDAGVSIMLLKRFPADADLASGRPYLPVPADESGKRVAVVGAGPAGLAAAYYLRALGHACTVFDDHELPGGALRYAVPETDLPRDVLAAEVGVIRRLNAEFRTGVRVGRDLPFQELRRQFDAVIVATGPGGDAFGLASGPGGIKIDRPSMATGVSGVFAAGDATRKAGRMAVRSVADGRSAAVAADQHLRGQTVTGPGERFNSRMGKPTDAELAEFVAGTSPAPRLEPDYPKAGFSAAQAVAECARCLHCDCRKPNACRLRDAADLYSASQARFRGERPAFVQLREHADVIFEPGKCIDCGLCIQVAAKFAEPLGLSFVGRGFNVRVAVPFGRSLADGLQRAAAECVAACPTGALAFKDAPAGR